MPHNLTQYAPFNFGMPMQMPSWQNFHPTQSGFGYENVLPSAHLHHQEEIELTAEMTLKPLSKKSVDEVCAILRSVDGLSPGQSPNQIEQNQSSAIISIFQLKSIPIVK